MLHPRMNTRSEERGRERRTNRNERWRGGGSRSEPFQSDTRKFSCGGKNKCNNEPSHVEFKRIYSRLYLDSINNERSREQQEETSSRTTRTEDVGG